MDVKATQAVEVTDISQTSVKSNDASTISSTRILPDVQFDSESSKENQYIWQDLRNNSIGITKNEYPETRNNDWILYAKSKTLTKANATEQIWHWW